MKVRYSPTPLIACLHTTGLVVAFGTIAVGWFWGLQPWLGEQQGEAFPTGIPWLESEAACVQTGRVWQDGTCWDNEHNPLF